MPLLRLVSWPYVRRHALRTTLTVVGIALGVAVFVSINAANDTVLKGFAETVDRIAGRTELEVTAGEIGFPEAILERVQSAQSVRVAVPVIEAIVDPKLRGQGSLLILGVDFTGDRSLRDYDFDSADEQVVDDPLVFLAQPDSLIVTKGFADRTGLSVGSRLVVGTVIGDQQLTVRGIMKAGGLASAFGGNLAVMDIYAAQKMFGRGRTFDRIDVALQPERSLDEATHELEALLGPGFQIEPPTGRGQQFEAILSAYSLMSSVSSLFALFIGMFIIYNSFAIAVTQRRFEIGILRVLGATRRQVSALFLLESLVMGVAGTIVGLVGGALMARVIARAAGVLVGDVYGLAQNAGDGAANAGLLSWALFIGIATSLIAAFIPSRMAAHVDPVRAIQRGKFQILSAGESRVRSVLAVLCTLGSIACLLIGRARVLFYTSYILSIVVAVLLTPSLALRLARLLRRPLEWFQPVEGALAADSLTQAPRRTSATVAALMLSLAMVVAFSGMARAGYASILDWANRAVNPDLFVTPSAAIAARTLRFPSAMTSELSAIPGIGLVQAVRQARIVLDGHPVMLVAVPIASFAATTRIRVVEGNVAEMIRLATSSAGVIVSDNLAQLRRLHLGDVIELPAPGGLIPLPIVGVVVDYSDQEGTVMIDSRLYEQNWHDDSVNFFRVYLAPTASWPAVRRRILEHYAGLRQVFVLNNDELKSYILRLADRWFGLTYVQVAVAILVALLGIVNTLTVSITDRRRELGVLRAVGGMRAQVKRTICLEALSLGAIGIGLGLALGALNLRYVLEIVRRDVGGMRLEYVFPTTTALQVTVLVLAAAFLAALWPATLALRGSLVEALEDE